jgi:hypothetical protein
MSNAHGEERGNSLAKIIELRAPPPQSRAGFDELLARLQTHLDAYRSGRVGRDATAWAITFTASDIAALAVTGASA